MVVWWLVLVGGYSPAWLMWDYHLSPDNRNSYETNRLYSCCLIVSYVVCTYIYLSNLSIYLSIHPSIYPSIHRSIYLSIYLSMRVSINGGTPKWLVYDGKSYQNRWFGDPPISGNSTYIYIYIYVMDTQHCYCVTWTTWNHTEISFERGGGATGRQFYGGQTVSGQSNCYCRIVRPPSYKLVYKPQ